MFEEKVEEPIEPENAHFTGGQTSGWRRPCMARCTGVLGTELG